MKKLFRSRENRKIGGVIAGLSRYLGVDVSILRIIFVLLLIFTGFMPMGLIYLIALFVIPYDDGIIEQ